MVKKHKVIHIINSFSTGGAEKVVLSYLEKFKNDKEFEVVAVSLAENRHKIYDHIASEKDLPILYLNLKPESNVILERYHQIKAIRNMLINEKPDIIHMHLSILNIVCIASLGLKIKAKFHTIHSDPRVTSAGWHKYLNMIFYKLFNVTPICLNNQMKSYADKMFKTQKTLVLPNGINLLDYHTLTKEAAKNKFGISKEQIVIGHVGRFLEVKNHRKLISVFAEYKKTEPHAILALVGEGPLEDQIREEVSQKSLEDSVVFFGARSDVPDIMQAFDCFVFTSLYEGLGIVVIEAQAAGVPCVISDSVPMEVKSSNLVSFISLQESDLVWAKEIKKQVGFSDDVIYNGIEKYSLDNVKITLVGYYSDAIEHCDIKRF
jgi:glycosyltransferase involved in cell wall biosynthesis